MTCIKRLSLRSKATWLRGQSAELWRTGAAKVEKDGDLHSTYSCCDKGDTYSSYSNPVEIKEIP